MAAGTRTRGANCRPVDGVSAKATRLSLVHQDLESTVQRGEILPLVGGSGTGKTVPLRQMLGLDQPARGA